MSSGNPWLAIPEADYVGHMASAEVGQRQALNAIFRQTLARYAPARLLVLGCSTGNGFEHIDPAVTAGVTGIDVNVVRSLVPGGALSVVLQAPSASAPAVSRTGYSSLLGLEALFRFVDPVALCELAGGEGLGLDGRRRIPLPQGKTFEVLYLRRRLL